MIPCFLLASRLPSRPFWPACLAPFPAPVPFYSVLPRSASLPLRLLAVLALLLSSYLSSCALYTLLPGLLAFERAPPCLKRPITRPLPRPATSSLLASLALDASRSLTPLADPAFYPLLALGATLFWANPLLTPGVGPRKI